MTPSIRVDLLKWLIAPLLIINLLGALLIYMLAWAPAQAALDQNLAEVAYDLRMHMKEKGAGIALDLNTQSERMLRITLSGEIRFVVQGSADRLAGDKDFPQLILPPNLNEPYPYSGKIEGVPMRIVALKTMVGERVVYIGVAETLAKRREIQSSILLALLALEAVLVVASVAIVWFAVTEGLFPLQKMQGRLNQRAVDDLSAIEEPHLPTELTPLIGAINGLLARAQDDGKARQSFLANVAHQLRTPLAGFKAQLELLQAKYAGEQDTARSVDLMMLSTDRMVRQANQLLSLARADPTRFDKRGLDIVELDRLVIESVQHFVREADKKDIDLGFDLHPARVKGDHFLLRDLIDNLVDNAIRYSPPGGLVTVRCMQDESASRLVVEDSGPGVPVSDREKIFSRFYRLDTKVAGSGLGLAIVADIAKDHDADVLVETGPNGKGTSFSVIFPGIVQAGGRPASEPASAV
jgi:two-component system, OmpR family, sensor histidine kinase TctE